MQFLANNNWPPSTVLRGLLTIVFVFWLISVMLQYIQHTTENTPKIQERQPLSNIAVEHLPLPPAPQLQPTTAKSPSAKRVEQTPQPDIEYAAKPTHQSSKSAQQVYEQLTEHSLDIQIAWPATQSKQQAALDFMYQCAGMQFAVLNGNNITRVNPTIKNDYSDWIRLAQGHLSQTEQHWLRAYALVGSPIRLFPKQIDFRLAQHLAVALKGKPLSKLRAKYHINNQTLLLNNIQLNNLTINGSWVLIQGRC